MVRLSVLASLLLSLVIPSSATSAPLAMEAEINGVRLPYVEQGSGEPVVFVHGVPTDLRSWEPVREGIAKKYHFIAYTQRYFGTGPWPDDGKNLSVATLADDLAKFIATLNAGPVHLVGWSYGGQVAATAAVKIPHWSAASFCTRRVSLRCCRQTARKGKRRARTAPKCSPRLSQRRRQVTLFRLPRCYRRLCFQLPPGEFDRLPQDRQTRVLDNARTLPLVFAAPPPPVITCDMLKSFARPTLVMRGEKTQAFYTLIAEAIGKCVPGAQLVVLPNVNHDGPVRDPAAFNAAVLDFLSKHPGL